ncbi:hypothetical protein WJX72_003723 [[Myrmecia] bisecta]|uniref:Uncharacterized protein n=1 Tax=[Myrmecia] bisecta TaxID=41462 RepID=A0AAW1PTZ0_9CHLO
MHRGKREPWSVNTAVRVEYCCKRVVVWRLKAIQACQIGVASQGLLITFWACSLVLLWLKRARQNGWALPFLWCFLGLWYCWGIYAASADYVHLKHVHTETRHDAEEQERAVLFALIRLVLVVSDLLAVVALVVLQSYADPAAGADGDLEEPLLRHSSLERAAEAELELSKAGRRWQLMYGTLHYLWPDTTPLKLRFCFACILILIGRAVNLAVPVLYKNVVDVLSRVSHDTHANSGLSWPPLRTPGCLMKHVYTFNEVFWPWVGLYLLLYFLQGGSPGASVGLLSNLRQILWIPITQRAYRRVSMDVFKHLLFLDLNFHLHRKTGQIMRILDRGTSSIQTILAVVLFNVVPQVIDIVAACIYMASALQGWVALIVFVTVSSYIPITVLVTEWRGKIRKRMNALDNDKEARATDMLLNYETVKYFTGERLELRGYGQTIDRYQREEYLQMAVLNALNILQSCVIFGGLAAGLAVCVHGIAVGSLTVGDAVLFLTMMNQLYSPLNFFGSYYRQVQKGLIDMENMFEMLATVPKVRDIANASTLQVRGASVAFDGVTFGYSPEEPVLKGVSFSVDAGHTLALVGATGSGKSTILRLLLRFYDPESGAVRIDGQNIAHVTQLSLRGIIGVVPQDTVLFNETIAYNIGYGRPSASQEEIEHAAKVAHIHDAIMRFPKGYNTVVGERGLRLSGGEKQRVAFARVVLKNPAILILDEATSALDSLTERMIQASLAEVRQRCTTIIVAHRLSTVLDADQLLVLENGYVAEQGSHAELIAQAGLYATMWQRQQEGSFVGSFGDLAGLGHTNGNGAAFFGRFKPSNNTSKRSALVSEMSFDEGTEVDDRDSVDELVIGEHPPHEEAAGQRRATPPRHRRSRSETNSEA